MSGEKVTFNFRRGWFGKIILQIGFYGVSNNTVSGYEWWYRDATTEDLALYWAKQLRLHDAMINYEQSEKS